MRPDITRAQILAAIPVAVGIVAKLLAAFGVYAPTKDQEDAITTALGAAVIAAAFLLGADAHLRASRNKADAVVKAARAVTPISEIAGTRPRASITPLALHDEGARAAVAGPPSAVQGGADEDGPGDHDDPIPHVAATDPAVIPDDVGDAGQL